VSYDEQAERDSIALTLDTLLNLASVLPLESLTFEAIQDGRRTRLGTWFSARVSCDEQPGAY